MNDSLRLEPVRPQGGRASLLSLNINSKAALYAAYMPFLVNGGLFVPTTKPYKLGDDLLMLLQLMDDPTKYPVTCTVVWITPAGAQGGRTHGVGVHFAGDEVSKTLRARIEQILAGHLGTNRPTHTL